MKPSLVVLAAAILVAAASASSGASGTVAKACSPLLLLPPAAPAGETTLYGHIKSLTRKGRRFELRFDPAWWLSGATATRAKLEDTGSSDVPNDYYVVEEGHRLLTYLVPATAHVTVLRHGTCTTRVTVSELARSVPPAGFWIRIRIDTVRSLDQQYQP
jgi:hypothetical protein